MLRFLLLAVACALLATPTSAQTPIHAIQGAGGSSPLVGFAVTTQGIVTAVRSNAFFIQTPDAGVDADPLTSQGIIVFTNSAPPAAAALGNLVQVTGTVVEFVPSTDPLSPPLTEIVSPSTVVLSTGNPLPAPVALTTSLPSPGGALDQLEHLEAMRVSVPSLTVVSPTQGSVSESNGSTASIGVFFGTVSGQARPFREAGIQAPDPPPAGTGTIPPIPRWDYNPELLRVDSDAQSGTTAIEVATGALVTGLTGVLDFVQRRHTILRDPSPAPGVTPGTVPPAVPLPTATEFTVATFNLQRLFDSVSGGGAVPTGPYLSTRLGKLSLAVRNAMRMPDVIAVQEVENVSLLQGLADRIDADAASSGQVPPQYVAHLSEGNNPSGLDVGFLVRTAPQGGTPRVTATGVTQRYSTETILNPWGSAETLFANPPLEIRVTVTMADGSTFPLTAIVVHLRDDSDVASTVADAVWGTVGARARAFRQAQATRIAQLVQTLQSADPARRIVVLGDFESRSLNDGYVDVLGAVTGLPSSDAATVVAGDGADLVNPDLVNLVVEAPAAERYQSSPSGNAEARSHVLVNAALVAATTARRVEHVRINGDFPETARTNTTTPTRCADADPVVAYFSVASALSAGDGPAPAFGVLRLEPNPAFGATRASFTLAGGEDARLEVFDLSGRRVESHALASPGPGTHGVELGAGRRLPPGVYLVRLEQGARTMSRRAVILQ